MDVSHVGVRVGQINTYVTSMSTGKIMGAEMTDGHCSGIASEESKGEQAGELLEGCHVV